VARLVFESACHFRFNTGYIRFVIDHRFWRPGGGSLAPKADPSFAP